MLPYKRVRNMLLLKALLTEYPRMRQKHRILKLTIFTFRLYQSATIAYRFLWDFPHNWAAYGWRRAEMQDRYWNGL